MGKQINKQVTQKVEYIRPLTNLLMTIGELPTSYLMSLTYEEQLLWFYNFLNEKIIPTINTSSKAVEELQQLFILLEEYVNNYLNDDNIQEKVNNKIDELIESGLMQELLDQAIEYAKVTNLNAIRVWREFKETCQFENEALYTFPQGMTKTKDNKFIQAYITEGTFRNGNYYGKLIEYDLDSNLALRESELLNIDHANTLAFNPNLNLIYVANRNYNDDEGVLGSRTVLTTVDYQTLSSVTQYDMGITVKAVAFDETTNKLYIANDTETTYIIYEVDCDINSDTYMQKAEEPIIIQKYKYAGKTFQSMEIYNNSVYILSVSPSTLQCYRLSDGKLTRNYSMPKFAGYTHKIKEVEDITHIGNGFEFLINDVSKLCDNNWRNLIALNLIDLGRNVTSLPLSFPYNAPQNIINLYVDINSTAIAPDGSREKPFKYIQEAVICAGSEFALSYQINVLTSGEYGMVQATNLGSTLRITGATDEDVEIAGITCSYSNNLIITNVKFNGEGYDRNGIPFVNSGGSVSLINCECTPSTGSVGFYLSNGKLKLNNTSWDNTNYISMRNNSELHAPHQRLKNISFADNTNMIYPNFYELIPAGNYLNETIQLSANIQNFNYLVINVVMYGNKETYLMPTWTNNAKITGSSINAGGTQGEIWAISITREDNYSLIIGPCRDMNLDKNYSEITNKSNVYIESVCGIM